MTSSIARMRRALNTRKQVVLSEGKPRMAIRGEQTFMLFYTSPRRFGRRY